MTLFSDLLDQLIETNKSLVTSNDQEDTSDQNMETLYSNYLADELDRPQLALQNMIELYRDSIQWERTLTRWLYLCKTPSEIIEIEPTITEAKATIRSLKEAIFYIDADRLGFIDGGSSDDCRFITHQSAITKELIPAMQTPAFLSTGKLSATSQYGGHVVQAGPEYFTDDDGIKASGYKTEHQLKATVSNFISKERRTEIYQAKEPKNVQFKCKCGAFWEADISVTEDANICESCLHDGITSKGYSNNVHKYSENMEAILNALWWNELRERQLRICSSTEPIYLSYIQMKNSFSKWEDKNGNISKPEHPVLKGLDSHLMYMRKLKIIQVMRIKTNDEDKSVNTLYIKANITRMEYDMKFIAIDDFNLVSNRDKYLPVKYKHEKEWYPRIGILMNGTMPCFYYDMKNMKDNEVWTDVKEGKTVKQILTKGGIPFKGSHQLTPEVGTDYSFGGKYSYSPSWGHFFQGMFLRALSDGKVSLCTKVEEKSDASDIGNCYSYHSQAYKYYLLGRDDFLKLDTQLKNFDVCVIKDITDEELVKLGLKRQAKATKVVESLTLTPINFLHPKSPKARGNIKKLKRAASLVKRAKSKTMNFSIIKKTKDVNNFMSILDKSPLILSITLIIPKVLLYTDINKQAFYERIVGKS